MKYKKTSKSTAWITAVKTIIDIGGEVQVLRNTPPDDLINALSKMGTTASYRKVDGGVMLFKSKN